MSTPHETRAAVRRRVDQFAAALVADLESAASTVRPGHTVNVHPGAIVIHTAAVAPNQQGTVHRLAYTRTEAAQALGVSVDFFDDHVALELRCVYRGRRRLYPVNELEEWLETNTARQPLADRSDR
jgi:hypothetical protein